MSTLCHLPFNYCIYKNINPRFVKTNKTCPSNSRESVYMDLPTKNYCILCWVGRLDFQGKRLLRISTRSVGFDGFGRYSTFFSFDIRPGFRSKKLTPNHQRTFGFGVSGPSPHMSRIFHWKIWKILKWGKHSLLLQNTLQKRQVASRHNSHPGSFSKNQSLSVCGAPLVVR